MGNNLNLVKRIMLMDKKSHEQFRDFIIKIDFFLHKALDKLKNKLILYMSGGEK